MSTKYYELRKPFTSIRLEEGPGHDRITLWEGHANAGTLTVTKGRGRTAVKLFVHDLDCPIHTYWGGQECGVVVIVHDTEMPDTTTVVSEYGDAMTVAEVKALNGAHRHE
jgi:hypothetical protein